MGILVNRLQDLGRLHRYRGAIAWRGWIGRGLYLQRCAIKFPKNRVSLPIDVYLKAPRGLGSRGGRGYEHPGHILRCVAGLVRGVPGGPTHRVSPNVAADARKRCEPSPSAHGADAPIGIVIGHREPQVWDRAGGPAERPRDTRLEGPAPRSCARVRDRRRRRRHARQSSPVHTRDGSCRGRVHWITLMGRALGLERAPGAVPRAREADRSEERSGVLCYRLGPLAPRSARPAQPTSGCRASWAAA